MIRRHHYAPSSLTQAREQAATLWRKPAFIKISSQNELARIYTLVKCIKSTNDMSYCKQEGKDRIIFVTKEEHEAPSSAELIADDPSDPYEEQGLILPNGDINWNCPCLGGMASGPCGSQFKEAFSCFHYSKEEVKGSECIDHFRNMQECMQKYPELYPQEEEKESPPHTEVVPDQDSSSSAQSPPPVSDSGDLIASTLPTEGQSAS